MNNCLTQIAKKASHWKTLENLSNFFLHYFHYFSPFHLKTRYTPGTLWIHFFIQQLATEGNTSAKNYALHCLMIISLQIPWVQMWQTLASVWPSHFLLQLICKCLAIAVELHNWIPDGEVGGQQKPCTPLPALAQNSLFSLALFSYELAKRGVSRGGLQGDQESESAHPKHLVRLWQKEEINCYCVKPLKILSWLIQHDSFLFNFINLEQNTALSL